MASPAAVLSILVTANTKQAMRNLAGVNSQLKSTDSAGRKALTSVKQFAKGASVATAAGLGYAVKKAADFEQQLDSLGAVSDATGKQMNRLRKQAMKAGADTKFSALEAAQAQTELAKGGLSVSQIMKGGLRSSLALAAAGEMDLAQAAEATVNAMKLFGLRGKDAMKVADGFATAANQTTADVSDFAQALKMGGSAAKAAGLTFTETTSILEALAEGGIKGSDAGTSMKAMLVQLAAPTEKQAKLTKKLGLSFFDAEGNMKEIPAIAAMLGDKLEGMSRKQQLATVETLAGTDGMRALLSIYSAGLEKIEKLQKGLEKQGTAADVAAKKQDNLKGKLENLMGSVETIAISIGSKLLPVLSDYAEQITDILNDPKLTSDQKLDRLAKMAGEVVSKGLSAAADKAAQLAPKVAEAFINGFMGAGVWGRLAISAWLLRKLGGTAAFAKIGGSVGAGVGTGMADGVARSGLKGRLTGLMRSWGPTLGIALGLAVVPSLAKKLREGGVSGRIPASPDAATTSTVGESASEMVQMNRKAGASFDELNAKLKQARESWTNLVPTAAGDRQRQYFLDMAAAVEDVRAPFKRVELAFDRMRKLGTGDIETLRDRTADAAAVIKRELGKKSADATSALSKNFQLAREAVKRSMDAGVISTRDGLREIRRLMVKELRDVYGFSAERARNYVQSSTGDIRGIRNPNPGGGHQRGGPIYGGGPSGDTIPAMLERGEYVLNRKAVQAIGPDTLDALNFAMAPRFQKGGIVELLHPFNDPAGHGGSNSHLHIAASTVKRIVAIGRKLQRMGWLVGEHPAFGGIQARHAPGGYHYTGQAIDANWPVAGEEVGKIRQVLAMLGAGRLGARAKLGRVKVRGDLGVVSAIAQRAVDAARRGAQAKLDRAGRIEGAEPSGVGGGGAYGKSALRNLWRNAGGPSNVANIAAAIALAESGGRPGAKNVNTNGSIDRGLWQINSIHGRLSTFNVGANARAAVKIWRDAGGFSPWVTYKTGAYRQFLRRGGRVGFKKGGKAAKRGNRVKRGKVRAGAPNIPLRAQTIADLNLALALAEQTPDVADNIAALQGLLNVELQRAADIRQSLRKPGLSARRRVALTQQLTEATGRIGDFRSRIGEFNVASDAVSEVDTRLAEAQEEANRLQEEANQLAQQQIEAVRALQDEVARQNQITGSTLGIGLREAQRAFADVISGQIVGHGVVPRSALPSNGQVASY